MRRNLVFACLLFVSFTALVCPAETVEKEPPPFYHWYGYFQANAFGAFETGRGYSIAPEISWDPTFWIGNTYFVRANFALTWGKNQNLTNRVFNVIDTELLAGLAIDHGYLDFGGGVQSWAQNGGPGPVLSTDVGWPMNYGLFERLWIGYSAFFLNHQIAHELKFGVGVGF